MLAHVESCKRREEVIDNPPNASLVDNAGDEQAAAPESGMGPLQATKYCHRICNLTDPATKSHDLSDEGDVCPGLPGRTSPRQ